MSETVPLIAPSSQAQAVSAAAPSIVACSDVSLSQLHSHLVSTCSRVLSSAEVAHPTLIAQIVDGLVGTFHRHLADSLADLRMHVQILEVLLGVLRSETDRGHYRLLRLLLAPTSMTALRWTVDHLPKGASSSSSFALGGGGGGESAVRLPSLARLFKPLRHGGASLSRSETEQLQAIQVQLQVQLLRLLTAAIQSVEKFNAASSSAVSAESTEAESESNGGGGGGPQLPLEFRERIEARPLVELISLPAIEYMIMQPLVDLKGQCGECGAEEKMALVELEADRPASSCISSCSVRLPHLQPPRRSHRRPAATVAAAGLR